MNKSFLKKNTLMKIISNSLIYLPTPVSINLWWNFGSLLGMCLMVQIITGLLLSMHYISNVDYSFFSIVYIMKDVNYGWLMRLMHMNGASFFFICLYIHLGRGLYYGSFKLTNTWLMGVLIMLMLMAIAFMGYVLPWGQMSYWGATVITNLMTVIPYIGLTLVEWLWGGYSVDNATLSRFYTLHFFLPFILLMMVMLHLMFLHETGSNNPLGLESNFYKIIFHNYFTIKDLLGFLYLFLLMITVSMEYPNILADPSNFIMSSYKSTPIHIQPEWYFLFAYTILRSIPNKLGGVIGLLMSILILTIYPFLKNMNFQSMSFYPLSQMYFYTFIYTVIFLTWIGSQSYSVYYYNFSKYLTLFYFMYFLINYYLIILWDKIMN